ncbi:hypothetical protein A5762_00395 [Mycolicibacterium elephantis]|nr:hypothetical protein A5762_00395 [Mycolicibacterium elephantis]
MSELFVLCLSKATDDEYAISIRSQNRRVGYSQQRRRVNDDVVELASQIVQDLFRCERSE